MNKLRHYFRFLSLILTVTGIAEAQQYSFRAYGGEQGLNNLAVKSLHQDKQGFLWVSTEDGIYRYDGERFQPFGAKNGMPASSGIAFGEAPDGSLLAGGQIGLFRKVGERFEPISMPGAKSVSWFSGIQSDGKGSTWVATDAGLMVITRPPNTSGYAFRLIPKPSGVEMSNAYGLLVEEDGVWYGCDKQLCRYSGGDVTVFGLKAGLPASQWKGIQRAGNGDLWAQGRSQVVRLPWDGTRFEVPESPFGKTGSTGVLSKDSAGRVIVGTTDGLAIWEGNSWKSVGRESGLRGCVYRVLQDREGSLWIGLLGRGLVRWVGYREWEAFTSDSGLDTDIVYETLPLPDGTVWAATEAGLFRGGKAHDIWTWRRQPQLNKIPIHSIRRDGVGRLWLGTESNGAARFNPETGDVEWFTEKQGLNAKSPYTLALDNEHRIWAATEKGLFVADLSTLRFRQVEQVPAVQIWTAIQSANGDIWVGSAKGLFRFSAGTWTHLTEAMGLSHQVILTLAGAKNGDVWVGYRYGGGLDEIRIKGGVPEVVHPVNNPGGKPSTVYFLGFDARERLWAGTDRGVDVLDGSTWNHYDRRDGLVWDDCDLNGFAAGPDGSVWLGTSGGLARFTPQQAAPRVHTPEVIYTKLVLGTKEVEATTRPIVDHSVNMLHARFSALTFARESSILFRYRLSPLLDVWRETQQRELQFDGLPSGKYRLDVVARDGWGRWSAKPAAFSFQILAPWWRASWVLPVLCALPVGLVVLLARLREIQGRRRERNLVYLVEARTANLKDANQQLLRLSHVEFEKNLADKQRAHAEEVARLNRRAIETLALAIEAKDETTTDHLRRVEVYAIEVAKEMGLVERDLEALGAAALLHDVGKLTVPEYIISKPGRLTPEEFEKMKTHTVVGAEIVEQIGFPYPVAPIVRSHHEKWNGAGYPDGLSRESIPVGARILAAVDCLDALVSDRQYRRALPLEEAIRIIQSEAGKSFDPAVVEILVRRRVELELLAKTRCTAEKTRLSTDLKIARGQAPAAGFEVTASPAAMNLSLINLYHSLAQNQPERALADLIKRIANCADGEALFAVLRESLRSLVPYDLMAVYLCRGERLIPEGVDGEDYRLFASVEIQMGEGLSGWVAENRKPIINGNPAVEPGYLSDPASFSVLRSALAIPLESEGRAIGVLSLYSTGLDSFSPGHLTHLLSLGESVTAALGLSGLDRGEFLIG